MRTRVNLDAGQKHPSKSRAKKRKASVKSVPPRKDEQDAEHLFSPSFTVRPSRTCWQYLPESFYSTTALHGQQRCIEASQSPHTDTQHWTNENTNEPSPEVYQLDFRNQNVIFRNSTLCPLRCTTDSHGEICRPKRLDKAFLHLPK